MRAVSVSGPTDLEYFKGEGALLLLEMRASSQILSLDLGVVERESPPVVLFNLGPVPLQLQFNRTDSLVV